MDDYYNSKELRMLNEDLPSILYEVMKKAFDEEDWDCYEGGYTLIYAKKFTNVVNDIKHPMLVCLILLGDKLLLCDLHHLSGHLLQDLFYDIELEGKKRKVMSDSAEDEILIGLDVIKRSARFHSINEVARDILREVRRYYNLL